MARRKWAAMSEELKPVELTAIETNTGQWVPFPIPRLEASGP